MQLIDSRIRAEQISMHCASYPITTIAQTLGGIHLFWVLWNVVPQTELLIGAGLLTLVLFLCMLVYFRYRAADRSQLDQPRWSYAVVGTSLALGCLWGSAAVFLYPPLDLSYLPYLILLFAILPFVPVVAYAGYMPAFFAYYIPCTIPFVVVLLMEGDRPGINTATLFVMLIIAALVFAIQHNRSVIDSIRLRLKVEQQNDLVEQATLSKSKFLAAAGHDLRQPLQAVTLHIDALHAYASDPKVASIQNQLSNSAETLHILVDSLLDISKLDAGIVSVEKHRFPLNPMIEKVVSDFQVLAHEKKLLLSSKPMNFTVDSDPILLERVLRNLIHNAIQYTRTGSVLVHHEYSDSRLELKITDTGVGISTIDKARIFEEFTQIGNAERDRRKGLGLGLALVKRLLELLEHPLHLSSVVDHGSTFSITLPIAGLDDYSPEKHSQSHGFTAKELAGRVLVCIDDEPDIRVAMETLADAWKCDIVTAANDTDALVKIQRLQCRVDILIVDFRLRDKHNGVDAAHDLMANLGYTVPVIIITGDTAEAPLKAAHESGFTLLHKPLKPKRLESCINKALITNDQLRSLTT